MEPKEVTKREAAPIAVLRDLLVKLQPQIEMALPRHLTAERMIRVALTALQRTPALLDCDARSIAGAVIQASQLGLEPDGVLGHAYLVPFKNRKTGRAECQLMVGYKGLIDLARRSGHVLSIGAHVVHANDSFTFSYGIEDKLEHKPSLTADRGAPVAVYAVARLKDSGYAFEVMSVPEIEAIRASAQAGKEGPWATHWTEMARKTVVRRLCKYLPLSPELQTAVALDERAEAGLPAFDVGEQPAETATRKRTLGLKEKYRAPDAEEGPDAKPQGIGPAEAVDVPAGCACPDAPAGRHEADCPLAG